MRANAAVLQPVLLRKRTNQAVFLQRMASGAFREAHPRRCRHATRASPRRCTDTVRQRPGDRVFPAPHKLDCAKVRKNFASPTGRHSRRSRPHGTRSTTSTRPRTYSRTHRNQAQPIDCGTGRRRADVLRTLRRAHAGDAVRDGRRVRSIRTSMPGGRARFANRQGLESQAPGRSRRAEWFRRAPPIHEARLRRRPPTGCINASMPAAPVATPTTGIEVGTQEVLESFLLRPRRRCGSRWDRARSGVDRNAASGGTSAPARRMQPSPSGEVQCQWSSSSSSSA